MAGPKPTSTFSRIFRRSKFASFDPQIGQVYTTYGGYAHRGDWGLKRPIPTRKRRPFATIRTIDSKQQQTEYENAETDARWIKRWEETGRQARLAGQSGWAELLANPTATTYQRRKRVDGDAEGEMTVVPGSNDRRCPIPNVNTMTDKEFERYLHKARAAYPKFKATVTNALKQDHERKQSQLDPDDPKIGQPLPPTNMYGLSQRPSVANQHSAEFLSRTSYAHLTNPKSTAILSYPHPTAALRYAPMSLLQTHLMYPSIPGRVLESELRTRKAGDLTHSASAHASLGGIVASLNPANSDGITGLELGKEASLTGSLEPERHATKFRIAQASLSAPPTVVGHTPEGVKNMDLAIDVQSWLGVERQMPNPHRPGSMEYVAHKRAERPGAVGSGAAGAPMQRTMRRSMPKEEKKSEESLLGTLDALIADHGAKR